MEFHQLECFLAVARTQHMTQAAEQLHMTQPSLSKVIARLEEDLGTKLFYREGRSIRLNEQGELAVRYAENLLHLADDMRTDLAQITSGNSGSIRIGSSYSTQETGWLLECVRAFLIDRPNISFSLQNFPPDQLASALENREVDLAVTMQPLRTENIFEGIQWNRLFSEPMGVILSANHPLAQLEKLSLIDLQDENFLCNDANSDTRELTVRLCEAAGFHPRITFECWFPTYIGEAVSRGLGVSLISEAGNIRSQSHAEAAPWEANVTFRPLRDEHCVRTYGIAYLKSRHLPKCVWDFHTFLNEYIAEGRMTYGALPAEIF